MPWPDPATATAAELDAADPLAAIRGEFELPEGIYFVGNSLGPLPRGTRDQLAFELERWSTLGVEGHFEGETAWVPAANTVTDQLAALTGARREEVITMNALTVNLHLMLISFYRPTPQRHKILIEAHAFPSDHFAVESQIRQRGYDPATSLVVVEPRPGDETLDPDDILAAIADHADELALILLPGVHYYTGQVLPMPAITEAGHAAGAVVGFDLAHAIGNIPMQLHDWGVDFAAWCTYKYLNSGPGGVAGAYVHERHIADPSLPKLLGWWGHKEETRFQMANEFDASPTVASWQLSTPPALAIASLRAALNIVDQAGGIDAMRAKSEVQIAYMDRRLAETMGDRVENLSPSAIPERGCQFALRMTNDDGQRVFDELQAAHVHCDWRYPAVIRVAPVPLYNSFADIDRFVDILDGIVA